MVVQSTQFSPVIVRLEVNSIQRALFSVSDLRTMLGANALLGNAIRQSCVQTANESHLLVAPDYVSLPKFDGATKAEASHSVPAISTALLADPLHRLELCEGGDNPELLAQEGILARDGGHFNVLVKDNCSAIKLIKALQLEFVSQLPDIDVSFYIDRVPHKGNTGAQALADLPGLQRCLYDGRSIATEMESDKQRDKQYLSDVVLAKRKAGAQFSGKRQKNYTESQDIITLLAPHMPGLQEKDDDSDLHAPEELADIADAGGYIALVHADGNSLGERSKQWLKENKTDNPISDELIREQFFYSARVAMRRSLLTALHEVVTDSVLNELPLTKRQRGTKMNTNRFLPYQPLMLGGDDLLLLCRPDMALPLVESLARWLQDPQNRLVDSQPLGIGAGVVIAPHHLPFHRLHQLVEQLTASAKAKVRSKGPQQQVNSVVDWATVTNSWCADISELRRRESLQSSHGDTLAMSAKPYMVYRSSQSHDNGGGAVADKSTDTGEITLQELLATAGELRVQKDQQQAPPHSQLKSFVTSMREGRCLATLRYRRALAHFPNHAKEALGRLGHDGQSPWQEVGHRKFLTRLLDAVELVGLSHLGRQRRQPVGSATAAATDS